MIAIVVDVTHREVATFGVFFDVEAVVFPPVSDLKAGAQSLACRAVFVGDRNLKHCFVVWVSEGRACVTESQGAVNFPDVTWAVRDVGRDVDRKEGCVDFGEYCRGVTVGAQRIVVAGV